MADVALAVAGVQAAPLEYLVPGAQEIIVKSAFATFDGSGSGSAFLPALKIVSPAGMTQVQALTDDPVAAGASADVSFFPGAKRAKGAASTPPQFTYAFAGFTRNQVIANNVSTACTITSFRTNDPTNFFLGGVGQVNYVATSAPSLFLVATSTLWQPGNYAKVTQLLLGGAQNGAWPTVGPTFSFDMLTAANQTLPVNQYDATLPTPHLDLRFDNVAFGAGVATCFVRQTSGGNRNVNVQAPDVGYGQGIFVVNLGPILP